MAELRPGQIYTRGLLRAMHAQGWSAISEVTLATGRRVDAMAIDSKGEITVVEVKSSVADFQSDGKWHEYRDFCDRFYFAVPVEFPQHLLPGDSGLFVVDPYGGALIRDAPVHKLSAARRKALLITFASLASRRLHLAERALDDAVLPVRLNDDSA
jgi:hypothetical protein